MFHWSGAVSNLMSVAGNYTENLVPGEDDTVLFDGNPIRSAVLDAAFPEETLAGVEITSIYSGTFTVENDIFIRSLSIDQRSMSVALGVTVTANQVDLDGATLTGAGTFKLVADGLGNFGAMLVTNYPQDPNPIRTTTIEVGQFDIDATSTVTVQQSFKLDGSIAENQGTINWQNGTFSLANSALLHNTGTLSITGDTRTTTPAGFDDGVIENAGKISVNVVPTATVEIGATFIQFNTPNIVRPFEVSAGKF